MTGHHGFVHGEQLFSLVDKDIERLRNFLNVALLPLNTVEGYYQFERIEERAVDPRTYLLARGMRWCSDENVGWIALSCLGNMRDFPHLHDYASEKEMDLDGEMEKYLCVEVRNSVEVNVLAMEIGDAVYNELNRESACAGEFLYKFAQGFFQLASSMELISFVVKKQDDSSRHNSFCFGPVGWHFDAYPQELWPPFNGDGE